MVERVARAMCVADGCNPDALPNEDYADGSEVLWMTYGTMARAAIAAMREPTEAIMEAFSAASTDEWRAAIDAAIA